MELIWSTGAVTMMVWVATVGSNAVVRVIVAAGMVM